MAYVPDPTNVNLPTSDLPAGTADEEFRALKAYIALLTGFSPNVSGIRSINGGSISGFVNRILNHKCELDRFNNGAAVTPVAGPRAYVLERFCANVDVSSKLTFQQVADAPVGMHYSEKITVATQYAPAAGEQFWYAQLVKGDNIEDMLFGTATPTPVVISFYAKATVAGVYPVALRNSAINRSYVGTVNITTSWTQVSVVLTPDTAGTWLVGSADVGCYLQWDLGSGTGADGTAGVWNASGSVLRTADCVTLVNQVAGSALYITGVDFRPGTVPPAYPETRSSDIEKILCNCYKEKIGGYLDSISKEAYALAANVLTDTIYYKQEKFKTPILTKVGTWNATNCGQPTVGGAGLHSCYIATLVTATGSASYGTANATTYIVVDGEL